MAQIDTVNDGKPSRYAYYVENAKLSRSVASPQVYAKL